MRVASRVRQDTFITYEPLLLLALVYLVITGISCFALPQAGSAHPIAIGLEHANMDTVTLDAGRGDSRCASALRSPPAR